MSSYIVFTTETSRPSTFQTQVELHSSMISSLTDQNYGSDSRIFYAYDTVFKGFAAILTTQEAKKIKKILGVSTVFEDTLKTRLHTTRSPQFLGLNENNGLWPEARFGDDIIIASERSPVVATFLARAPNPMVPEVLKPDLIAPGFNMLGDFPPNVTPTSLKDWRRVNYNLMSGMSMACPHVARATTLLL